MANKKSIKDAPKNRLDVIICIIGKSGSGKTTVANLLKSEAGYNLIESYTTRPKRNPGETGHLFVNDQSHAGQFTTDYLENMTDEVIAPNYYDGHHYWAERWQYRGMGRSVYIVEPVGLEMLKQEIQDACVLSFYLNVDNEIRKERMWQSGRSYDHAVIRESEDARNFFIVQCDCLINITDQTPAMVADVIRDFVERVAG